MEKGDKMTDCKGRPIDQKIMAVIRLKPGEHPTTVKRKETEISYVLCEEFFHDGASPECTVPAMFASACNSAYRGWQKADLRLLDKELYRPAGQRAAHGVNESGVDRYTFSEAGRFDEAMSQVVWFRFIWDEAEFLRHRNGITSYQSSGLNRKLLAQHGYEYCGFRTAKVEERDCLGYTTTGYGIEIWAHASGVITTFETQLEGAAYYSTPCMYIKRTGDHRFARIGGGSQSYCSGQEGKTPGTVIWHQTAPARQHFNIWSVTKDPDAISCWGEGVEGLYHLNLWCSAEVAADPQHNEDFFKELHEETALIADKYPLLRQICCEKVVA